MIHFGVTRSRQYLKHYTHVSSPRALHARRTKRDQTNETTANVTLKTIGRKKKRHASVPVNIITSKIIPSHHFAVCVLIDRGNSCVFKNLTLAHRSGIFTRQIKIFDFFLFSPRKRIDNMDNGQQMLVLSTIFSGGMYLGIFLPKIYTQDNTDV